MSLQISASQDETFNDCRRKWWFQSIVRMPSPPKTNTVFGTVFHAVAERWLKADERGVDPKTGEPVELFPEDWDLVSERGQKLRLPPGDAAMLRRLFQEAVDAGVLVRSPDRKIEHLIRKDVIEGVTLKGFVDVLLPGEIQDHKTTRNMRYAKSADPQSPDYLGKSKQMLLYATEAGPGSIRLRHNVICWDRNRPAVRTVEAEVTQAEIDGNWKRLQAQAAEMLHWSECPEERWKSVPASTSACSKYGGCPFVSICGGKDTTAQYRERIQRLLDNEVPATSTWADAWAQDKTEVSGMDIFAKRVAAKKAEAATGPAVAINGGETPAQEKNEVVANAPPWANPACMACKGSGFNSNGDPCRICDTAAAKKGKPTSMDFTTSTDDQGNITWKPKDQGDSGKVAVSPVETKVEERKAPDTQTTGPNVEVEIAKVLQVEEPKKGRGRPKAGFRLFVNCIPMGSKAPTESAEAIFTKISGAFASDAGKESFFDLDPFKRRELWRRNVEAVKETIGRADITVRSGGGDPDLMAMINALRLVADEVVEGLS